MNETSSRRSFLTRAGFSDNFASRVKNNNVKRLGLIELEKLCLILNCSPNDLYEWVPDENSQVDKDHELNKIRRTDKVFNLTQALHKLSMQELEKVEGVLNQALKKPSDQEEEAG